MTFVKRLPGGAVWLGLGLLLSFLPHDVVGLTTGTVQGTVYRADGSVATGTLLLSWPAFTTSANEAVAAGSKTVSIGANGWVAVGLAANGGAFPDGTYYTAVYHLSDGTTSTEYWIVPSAATVSLGSVRSKLMPTVMAVQTVSRQYVDSSIAGVTTGFVQSSGGSMSGALLLSADPTTDQQAATKSYVDQSASALLSTTGGAMKGSLLLGGDPAVDSEAATKRYVDQASSAAVAKAGGSMTGPLTVTMINGKAFPAGGTLQQMVTAAGSAGSVEIPANYAGTDTFTNPNGIPVLDQRVMEWRSVTEWGVKCDVGMVSGPGTDNYQALHDAFVASVNPYKPFGLKFPAGKCYSSKPLPYTCQYLKGVGRGSSLIVGAPGQDVLSNMDPNDRTTDGIPGGTGSGICGWQGITVKGAITDLSLQVDTSIDTGQLYTTLSAGINATATTLTLGSTQYYRRAGFVLVDQELIHYTVLSGNTITTSNAVDRGYGGTVAVSHAANAPVHYLGDLAFSGQGSAWAPKAWVSSISHTPAAHLRTWLNNALNPADTTLMLGSVTGLPTSGMLQIGNELLTYSGLSGNTLSGVVHGVHNTTASYHSPQGSSAAGETVLYSSYLPGVLGSLAPAGSTSLTLAYAGIGFPASGTLLIDSERIAYSAISGTTITTSATVAAHSPKAVVNVVDALTAAQTTIAITDNPSGTPLGYADFGGFGEVIGAMGIDYANGSREYITYTDGEPYIIPESLPTQYFLVYHNVNRGQTSTTAVAHASTAVVNAVNPFTFTTPTQNGTNNGVIPAWNIGACGLAFHTSDPGALGTLTTNPTMGNPDLSNFEVLGSNNSAGTNTCGIFYQSWPYAVTVKDYHIANTNYGIMWALAGVNNSAQGFNSGAGWINTSPYNKFQNGTMEVPMPWFSFAGPQKVSELNIESGPMGANTPFSESRVPSDGHATTESGYVIGSDIALNGVSGEFNLANSWQVSPFYPMGALYDGLTTDGRTGFGSSWVTQRPFYLATTVSDIRGQMIGNVILTPDSYASNLIGFYPNDLGADNTSTGIGPSGLGLRKVNGSAQIQEVGQSRPDAFLMGNVNGDWFNSLVDLKIEPEDMMSNGAGRGLQGAMVADPNVPLGRGKAFHLVAPGNAFGQAGSALGDSGIPLGSRINYGKGTMYVSVKADSGPTTQQWLMNVTGSSSFMAVTCNLTASWSVCSVPYDTTTWGRGSIGNAQIVASATANGTGVSLGPIVFSPKWDSINVATANVDSVVATAVTSATSVTAATVVATTAVSAPTVTATNTITTPYLTVTKGLVTAPAASGVMDYVGTHTTRLVSMGPNASTNGEFEFDSLRGDSSNYVPMLNLGISLSTFVTPVAFTVPTGTAPITVSSTTPVANLTLATASQIPNLPASQITGLAVVATSGSYANLANKPAAGVDFVMPSGSITGNAGTASSLATAPTLCSVGQAATGILANGNATGCATYAALVSPSFTTQATAPKFIGVMSSEADIVFSATPTFNATANLNYMSLTANVTLSTLASGANGQSLTFVLCQDATGSRTFVWPSNVRGGMTIGATASKCSSQSFTYVNAVAKWLAAGMGSINE